jgi:flagellar motor component MotA
MAALIVFGTGSVAVMGNIHIVGIKRMYKERKLALTHVFSLVFVPHYF